MIARVTTETNFCGMVEKFLFFSTRLSTGTKYLYRRLLTEFSDCIDNDMELATLSSIMEFLSKKRDSLKTTTYNSYVNALKSFFKWANIHCGCEDMGKYLHKDVAMPPRQRILAQDEYAKICQLPEYNHTLCIKLMCNTGLRADELSNLRPYNVVGDVLRIIGKGRKNRSIPLNKTAVDIIRRYPRLDFVTCPNRYWLWAACNRVSKKAGVDHFNPHACRHYFANELYHRGIRVSMISRLLGHASTTITEQIYIHWAEERLTGVTDVLD